MIFIKDCDPVVSEVVNIRTRNSRRIHEYPSTRILATALKETKEKRKGQ